MAGFLYYLPGKTQGVHLADMDAVGLGYAFDSQAFSACGVMANGLDAGGQGVVVADPTRVPTIGMYRDTQVWRKMPGRETLIGYYKNARPAPANLARKVQLRGHEVELADGDKWLCPVARGVAESGDGVIWYHAVPTIATRDDEGHWQTGAVHPKFAALWELTERWLEYCLGPRNESGIVQFTFDNLYNSAAQALGTNYMVGPDECDALGSLTEEIAEEILNALIDWPNMLELQKKIAARHAILNTADGPPVTGPDTDRQ